MCSPGSTGSDPSPLRAWRSRGRLGLGADPAAGRAHPTEAPRVAVNREGPSDPPPPFPLRQGPSAASAARRVELGRATGAPTSSLHAHGRDGRAEQNRVPEESGEQNREGEPRNGALASLPLAGRGLESRDVAPPSPPPFPPRSVLDSSLATHPRPRGHATTACWRRGERGKRSACRGGCVAGVAGS